MKEIFMNEKPVMALVAIRRHEEPYSSKISKEIDTTYSHTVKVLSRLEEEGLVEGNKEGRKKILELTEEGREYSEAFMQLLDLFEESGQQVDRPESLETEF